MNEREKIGQRIEELRKKKGLSQKELAEKTGIPQSNISRIESGTHSLGVDLLAKISLALDCEIKIEPLSKRRS